MDWQRWIWLGYNRGNNSTIGYDTGAINAIQEQLGNVQTQINSADRDFLMQTSGSTAGFTTATMLLSGSKSCFR